jgi:hypothetical protein
MTPKIKVGLSFVLLAGVAAACAVFNIRLNPLRNQNYWNSVARSAPPETVNEFI